MSHHPRFVVNDFIRKNFEQMSDIEMARSMGKSLVTIKIYREKLGLKRKSIRLRRKEAEAVISQTGMKDEIFEALMNGGDTVGEFIQKKKLPFSAGHLRTLLLEGYGLTFRCRTVLWYSNRFTHPELVDKERMKRLKSELDEKKESDPSCPTF